MDGKHIYNSFDRNILFSIARCECGNCSVFLLQAPVPEKTISANRGLNPANQGIKFVLRLDCVPQNTISTIPGIK